MAFVLIGLLFIVLRAGGWVQFAESDFTAWLIVLSPFALALAWWAWSDASGLTQRKAMDAVEAKKAERRKKAMEALGPLRSDAKKKR